MSEGLLPKTFVVGLEEPVEKEEELLLQLELLEQSLEEDPVVAADEAAGNLKEEPGFGESDSAEEGEKFEDLVGTSNGGNGMSNQEMMIVLKSCLHGSKKTIYENSYKAKFCAVGWLLRNNNKTTTPTKKREKKRSMGNETD